MKLLHKTDLIVFQNKTTVKRYILLFNVGEHDLTVKHNPKMKLKW